MPEQEPQAHSELATFGEELRREREIRGISLKEIADATKVSKRFLEAIERNDHHTLPAPVFTRGFVREYARYLGLSVEEIVNRYNFAASGDDRIEQSDHLDRLAHSVADREPVSAEPRARARRGIPPAYSRVDRNILVLVLVTAALGALIYWAVYHKREARVEEPAAVAPISRPAATPASTSASTSTTAPAPVPALASSVAGEPLRLTIQFTGDSWIKLDADGHQLLNDELKKGDRREYEAREAFVFHTIGNAGGVELALNGVRLPAFGGAGEVVHQRVLNRESLQQTSAARTEVPRTGT
jgi:cytoskeletal protein RodZ